MATLEEVLAYEIKANKTWWGKGVASRVHCNSLNVLEFVEACEAVPNILKLKDGEDVIAVAKHRYEDRTHKCIVFWNKFARVMDDIKYS